MGQDKSLVVAPVSMRGPLFPALRLNPVRSCVQHPGRPQGRPYRFRDLDNGMQMIGHDYIFFQSDRAETFGHLRPFGEEPSAGIHSRAYDADGNTFAYVYETEGDTRTIRGGQKGSPAFCRGVFDSEENQATGE